MRKGVKGNTELITDKKCVCGGGWRERERHTRKIARTKKVRRKESCENGGEGRV